MPPFFITVISAGVACAIGAGIAWRIQSATIAEMRLEHAETRIAAQRVARQAIERATSAVITAQNGAASRAPVLRAAAARTADIGSGLRIKTDSAVRTASSDPAACPESAAALGVVFNQCVAELTEMGAIADRHASDAQMMQEAWPK